MSVSFISIEDYLATFPENVQVRLREMHTAIRDAAPDAIEKFSYGMPTFVLEGNLVYFGGFRNHVSLFPAPRAVEAFRDELAQFKGSKGTVQFPLDKPVPADLIRRIVQFRVAENLERAASRKRR